MNAGLGAWADARRAGSTRRNQVERLWARLKSLAAKQTDRAIATRYEKTACSFMGALCLAASCDWIKATDFNVVPSA